MRRQVVEVDVKATAQARGFPLSETGLSWKVDEGVLDQVLNW